MSPQFHIVYNNLFQTVHSDEGKPPSEWLDLIVFDRFNSNFDDPNFPPEIADEWLTSIDLVRLRGSKLNHRN